MLHERLAEQPRVFCSGLSEIRAHDLKGTITPDQGNERPEKAPFMWSKEEMEAMAFIAMAAGDVAGSLFGWWD